MPVHTIISGGQIGADIAALRAAERLGLNTGGWMPLGFRTLRGDRPELASIYGMRAMPSRGYPPRTRRNVNESDGTMRFAHNFGTAGERCTANAIEEFDRPCYDIGCRQNPEPEIRYRPQHMEMAREWLDTNNIGVLNVAGNAAQWLEPIVEAFLFELLVPTPTN